MMISEVIPDVMGQDDSRMNWIKVGPFDDIPRQGSRILKTTDGNIGVFRSFDDQVFALRDQCPHKGGPLSQGIVHGNLVTCPLHNWSIDLTSGEAVAPDIGCVNRYDTKIEDGIVYLLLGG